MQYFDSCSKAIHSNFEIRVTKKFAYSYDIDCFHDYILLVIT